MSIRAAHKHTYMHEHTKTKTDIKSLACYVVLNHQVSYLYFFILLEKLEIISEYVPVVLKKKRQP